VITVLDCTFRDCGYYSRLDFSASLAQKYLHFMNNQNVEVIELGFRNFSQSQFLGAFAYSTDNFFYKLI